MIDYLTSAFSLFLSAENQLWLMFFSGFLSSTLLPGNSEIVFSTLVSQRLIAGEEQNVIPLWLIATFSNSLGSLTTYLAAFLLPTPSRLKNYTKTSVWAFNFIQKYGAYSLLLSWLPVVGDLLCGIAGWLRLPLGKCTCLIVIGKALRYAVIGWGIYAFIG